MEIADYASTSTRDLSVNDAAAEVDQKENVMRSASLTKGRNRRSNAAFNLADESRLLCDIAFPTVAIQLST